eukprot:4558856-Amphidinium_carterae.2
MESSAVLELGVHNSRRRFLAHNCPNKVCCAMGVTRSYKCTSKSDVQCLGEQSIKMHPLSSHTLLLRVVPLSPELLSA